MDETTQEDEAAPTVAESPAAIAGDKTGETKLGSAPKDRTEPDLGLEPTVTHPGLQHTPAASTGGRAGQSTTVATPHDALRLDELRRSRSLAATAVVLCPIASVLLPVLGGDVLGRWLAFSGLLMIASSNVFLFWVATPERYTEGRVAFIWLVSTIGLLPIIYYFGAFSGADAVLVLGIYFISQGHSQHIATLVYATAAVGHLAMGIGMVSGAIEDVGLLGSTGLNATQKAIALGLVQLIFLAVYMLARVSRRTMLRSVEELQEAVRDIAQREALLDEARQDIARAMRIGDAGRFTGATLGSYQLAHVIGRGAMGEVYLAAHTGDESQAAVKVLLTGSAITSSALERFLRETRIASSIDSPHVVKVLEVGNQSADIPYLAMELLEGYDLATVLRSRRVLDPEGVVDLIDQVGNGLHAASEAGIVHRDIKPHNLFFVSESKLWKILDFGVSKIAGGSGTLTQGAVVGTPGYMAPEQASGIDVDERADLYSLGAIAYRCITGRPPFSGRDLAPVLYKVVNEMPPAPSVVADVDRDFDYVLAIAMAKQPDDRFASAAELRDAVATASRGRVPAAIRRRGESLLARQPWHETIRGRSKE